MDAYFAAAAAFHKPCCRLTAWQAVIKCSLIRLALSAAALPLPPVFSPQLGTFAFWGAEIFFLLLLLQSPADSPCLACAVSLVPSAHLYLPVFLPPTSRPFKKPFCLNVNSPVILPCSAPAPLHSRFPSSSPLFLPSCLPPSHVFFVLDYLAPRSGLCLPAAG